MRLGAGSRIFASSEGRPWKPLGVVAPDPEPEVLFPDLLTLPDGRALVLERGEVVGRRPSFVWHSTGPEHEPERPRGFHEAPQDVGDLLADLLGRPRRR